MEEDISLMNLVKDGDKKAFEQLVLKYRLMAIKFAMKTVKNEEVAEDIVQDSFITIYIKRNQYNSKYNFKSYLFTIVQNKSIDYIRKEGKKSLKEIEPEAPSTEKQVIKNYDKKQLIKYINQLNDDYKKALYLYAYEEMSYKGIAGALNKNLAQVKILIYRARKKLCSIMEDDQC